MATTKNIQSLERGFAVLELFKQRNYKLSVREIADALLLSKSTAFGLINTLANLGYLQQDEQDRKYSLGFKVLALASAVQENNVIAQVAHPLLKQLSEEFQETCHCAVEENNYVIYIDKTEADRSVIINTRVGMKNPIYCTGVGKSILSFLPREKQKAILSSVELKAITAASITDKTVLLKALKEVRERGYATDDGEIEIGLRCVSVPVFDTNKEVIAAISLSAPSSRLDLNNVETLVKRMKEMSKEITRKLYF